MDERKLADARQMLREVALELAKATEAAQAAHAASERPDEREVVWKHLQQLYTRFDQATQLLKDMRRAVDAAMPSR